jgi:hypothetical protein
MPVFGLATEESTNNPILKAKNKVDGVSENSDKILEQLSKDVESGDVHVYLFMYWIDCGHCKTAYNDWEKFEKFVSTESSDKYSVYAIEQQGASELSSELLNDIGGQANGFPTFRYVHKRKSSDYNGERNINSLKEWMSDTSGGSQSGGGRKTRKRRKQKRVRVRKHKKTNKNKKGGGFFDLFVGVDRIRGQRYEKWLEQRLVSVHNDTDYVNKVQQLFGYDKTNVRGRGQLTKQMVDDELCKRSDEDRNLISPDLKCSQSGGRKTRKSKNTKKRQNTKKCKSKRKK